MNNHSTDLFESHRRHLNALAYRMLGSRAEAEDIVQDTWLRQKDTDLSEIGYPRAYLSRIATNLCLDRMQSARARREQYIGFWLPEPLEDEAAEFDPGPQARVEYAQNVSVAFMLALERLSALERAAFLLHDVFDLGFDEVGLRLDRSAAACRQLAARARVHVQADAARVEVTREDAEQLLSAFVLAIVSGDAQRLARLLANDAVMLSDGGGIVTAVARPLNGADPIAKALIGFARMWQPQDYRLRFSRINGLPGAVLHDLQGRAIQATTLRVDSDGRIDAIYVMRNPEKLAHLHQPPS